MESIVRLLGDLCPEIELFLRKEANDLVDTLGERYLPQYWVFQTEVETATLMIDRQGKASAHQGGIPQPDVTVRWRHDLLMTVIRTRSRASVPDGFYPAVQKRPPKGQAVFNLLREQIGL